MFSKRSTIFGLLLLPATTMAGEVGTAQQKVLMPSFQFQQQTINLGSGYDIHGMASDSHLQLNDTGNTTQGHVNQYDTTITYPLGQRDNAVNFDLGVNIRFIEGDIKNQDVEKAQNLNMAMPMLHARALFNLPFKGLTATVGGSHIEYDSYRAYDYKAKLNYSWNNGFGLEGGWQHQQFSIDGNDYQTHFETEGPYLDLKYRF